MHVWKWYLASARYAIAMEQTETHLSAEPQAKYVQSSYGYAICTRARANAPKFAVQDLAAGTDISCRTNLTKRYGAAPARLGLPPLRSGAD